MLSHLGTNNMNKIRMDYNIPSDIILTALSLVNQADSVKLRLFLLRKSFRSGV